MFIRISMLLVVIIFVISGCNSNNNAIIEGKWEEAKKFRVENELGKSITLLKDIIDNYKSSIRASEAQFQIADIYLNDVKDYDLALIEFKKVIENYENSIMAKKAIFMIGYIYSNNLDAFSLAMEYYNEFKTKYPNDELVSSVDYELSILNQYQTQIDSLNKIADERKGNN